MFTREARRLASRLCSSSGLDSLETFIKKRFEPSPTHGGIPWKTKGGGRGASLRQGFIGPYFYWGVYGLIGIIVILLIVAGLLLATVK